MITILTTANSSEGGATFLKIILFIYFIPSLIGLVRSPIIKWKFFTVFFINLFFGWTVYGWWLAFIKAFSYRNTRIAIQNTKQKSGPHSQSQDKYTQLEKLNNLRNLGAINEEEYENEKKKILN